MNKEQYDVLKDRLNHLKGTPTDSAVLNFDKLGRITDKLYSFSPNCEECRLYLKEVDSHLRYLNEHMNEWSKEDIEKSKNIESESFRHLQKVHKIITNGTYLATFMSIGMSLGIAFGIAIFDNIALGLPMGLSIGLAIGAGLDADAKKKGLTL
ncbi:hypothetical protein [Neobacillus niacini]|uniref:hypothetical protein n=1 Tax=Neobacillus niacini TaxID=86668 RepID=UPI0021CB239F|nr:hypothetical protein [Neobacillus niacini]MCM3766144.1 hypothetical protein [Neobacillus niacini]